MQNQSLRGHREGERVLDRLPERSVRLERRFEDLPESDVFLLERQLTARDTRNIEQIAHEVHQMPRLPLHDAAQVRHGSRVALRIISRALQIGAKGFLSSCARMAINSILRRSVSASSSESSRSFCSMRPRSVDTEKLIAAPPPSRMAIGATE